jgi:octaprenyl-diphosphate synthase
MSREAASAPREGVLAGELPAEPLPAPVAAVVDPAAAGRPKPPSPGRFLGLIAGKLAATEEVFRASLASDVPLIEEAGVYLADGGGKRVRPALLLLASRLLGHDGEEEVTYAAVVELIHTATLVHDDVIDHAHIRRGRTTVNRLWGNHKTVLLGDWLYTLAMQMALSHGRVEVIRRLVGATLRMTEGELLALERLGAPDLTRDEYFGIIDRKTARLFAAACSVPALIPPASPEADRVLGRYGEALGVCFQLVDDMLDFTGREEELGKPVLSDLKEGKLTLPLILLLPRVGPARRRLVEQVLEDRDFTRVAPEEILELVRAEGTLEEVGELAEAYAERARRELDALPAGDAREALELAPDFVLYRRS